MDTKCYLVFKKLLSELIKRLPDNLGMFRKLKVFSPDICVSQVARSKFEDLPFLNIFANKDDLFQMETQYNMLNFVNWAVTYGDKVYSNTLQFWIIVLDHKDAGGS